MGLFDIFSAAPGQKAAQDQIAGINLGKQEGEYAFGQGRDALTTNYAKGLQEWDPAYKTAMAGEASYADMTGLNGPEGNARAQAAFRNNPAYQFQLKQGLDAAKAQAAKGGTTMSGGQLIDLNNYAQGVANQGWGQYADRLSPFLNQLTAASGARAGIDTGLGNQLNANWGQQAGLDYGADTSIGKARAGGDLAGQQASGNLWGAGLALAGDVAQAIGGGGGKGGSGSPFSYASSLFDKFGSPSGSAPSSQSGQYT